MKYLTTKEMFSSVPIPTPQSLGHVIKFDKVALLDADHIKHIVTYNMFNEKEMIGDIEFYENREEILIEKTYSYAYSYLDRISDPIIFCFSGPSHNTFRSKLCIEKKYKGSRYGKKDPYDYEGKMDDSYKIIDLIDEKFNTLLFPDIEADDVLGFLHDENSYIISKDKDLLQCAGLHYCFDTEALITITEEEATRHLFKQILVGDTVDSIPGLFRYGEKAFDKDFLGVTGFQNYLNKTLQIFIDKKGNIEGTDLFAEMWFLIKTRINRGDYLKEKYKKAFDLKEQLLKNIKK